MTMENKKLNDNDLDIAGGKDKIKVESWDYVCHRCGTRWTRYNHWYTPEIVPTDYLKCPCCRERNRSYRGHYANGAEVRADELANDKRCPWK